MNLSVANYSVAVCDD